MGITYGDHLIDSGYYDITPEQEREIDRLHSRIELLENALKAIKRATLNGDVCNDVAWFDQIETLHDFCDRILDEAKEP